MNSPRTATLSPLQLTAKAVLGTTLGKAVGVDDVQRLKNPNRTGFYVEEIRFRLTPSAFDSTFSSAWLGRLGVKLDIGRLALTCGQYIPIGLLCTPQDVLQDALTATWKLPRPLYVPDGEAIIPSFYQGTDFPLAAQPGWTVFITFIGRSSSIDVPVPDHADVPVVSAWLDAVRVGSADYLAVRSGRSDLKNRFGEPLFVQRLSGGALVTTTTFGPGFTGRSSIGIVLSQDALADRVVNDFTTTQVFKSDGTIVARDKTPWQQLFPATTRSTAMMTVLRRNEFYQMQTDLRATNVTRAGTKIQLMAALIGYRRVKYANVRGYGYEEDNS